MKNTHLDEVLFDKFFEMLESKGIKPQGVFGFGLQRQGDFGTIIMPGL